jgi:hypothetical protein
MNAAVAQLLSTDTEDEIMSQLVYRLGSDLQVTCYVGEELPWTVFNGRDIIGEAVTKAEALAIATICLDNQAEPEPADDGSALEHEYFLRSER